MNIKAQVVFFCRNNGWLMENVDKELTHSTKMSADKSAQNTPNDPKIICPMPKSLELRWKKATSSTMLIAN